MKKRTRNFESKARKTFETFHARKPGNPVYPYKDSGSGSGEFHLDIRIPYMSDVGKAIRVYYDSDKWKEVGDVEGYYHNHGPEDGEHPFRDTNQIKLYAPQCYMTEYGISDAENIDLPIIWPKDLVPLGSCAGWLAQTDDGELLEGKCENAVLMCSPFGHVDSSDENRVFLAVIDIDDGTVEALMCGPDLRVTERGIEG